MPKPLSREVSQRSQPVSQSAFLRGIHRTSCPYRSTCRLDPRIDGLASVRHRLQAGRPGYGKTAGSSFFLLQLTHFRHGRLRGESIKWGADRICLRTLVAPTRPLFSLDSRPAVLISGGQGPGVFAVFDDWTRFAYSIDLIQRRLSMDNHGTHTHTRHTHTHTHARAHTLTHKAL